MRQPARALILLIAALLALGLAACDGAASEPTAIPATRTPTALPEITRIVPTPTATPLPTLAPELVEAVGEWVLRITLEMSEPGFAAGISYFGAARIQVDELGAIAGTGYFSPNVDGGACVAQVVDEDPITFRVSGAVVPTSAGLTADVRVIPGDRMLAESYRLICPDRFEDIVDFSAPYLWPVLSDADLLAWPLTLDAGERFPFEVDLSATTREFEGTLRGEVQITRG